MIVSMAAIPRLGLTLFLAIVVLGNMVGGVLYDHFGMFGWKGGLSHSDQRSE